MKLTPESFINVVKKSGLIESDPLKGLLQEFPQQGVNMEDSHEIAKAFVDRESLSSWQAEKLLKGKHRGFFLGKYRLHSLLGKGGMSSVYLADHVLMRRRCAIKVLPQKRVNDSSYLGRFHREAQAVAALDHPNIVRAYDVDVDRNVEKTSEIHFLVMEYVDGSSLQELVERQATPIEFDFILAADYTRQCADGLAHAHAAGMVHRDIKPANLLVDKNGVVRILDLGLARFFAEEDDKSLTVAHDEKVLGTADYLAPEQALDSHNVDERADIYSLGCTFYFLLTGHPPFTEGTLAQRLMAHQTKTPSPVVTDRHDVPQGLVAIVEKMMAKDVDERWSTAEDVSAALAGWLVENAGEEWKLKNPGLVGSGSGITGDSSVVPANTGTTDAVPKSNDSRVAAKKAAKKSAAVTKREFQTAQPVAAVDENEGELAAFLTNLGTSEPATDETALEPVAPRTTVAKQSNPATVPIATPVLDSQFSVPVAKRVNADDSQQSATAIRVTNSPSAQEIETAHPTSHASPKQATGWWQNGRNWVIAIAVVGAAIMISGGAWVAMSFFGGGEDANVPDKEGGGDGSGGGKKKLGGQGTRAVGEIHVGPNGKFKTIQAAISEAKKRYDDGDRKLLEQVISVAGGNTYSERIDLDNSDYSIDELRLSIVCKDDKPAILALKGTAAILSLNAVKNFELRGFEIKAEKRATAVKLDGACFDLKLRDVTITGFNSVGIHGIDLQAFSGSPAVFENLSLRPASPTADGMKFTGNVSAVKVTGCRFLGPMRDGILFSGDPNGVEIKHCVFYKAATGVHFLRQRKLRRTSIENNTFRELKAGISFDRIPTKDSEENVISKNIFSKITGPDAMVAGAKPKNQPFQKLLATDGMVGNMTDRNKPHAKDLPFLHAPNRRGRVGVKFGFASTDPASTQFLMPSARPAQRTSGAQPPKSR